MHWIPKTTKSFEFGGDMSRKRENFKYADDTQVLCVFEVKEALWIPVSDTLENIWMSYFRYRLDTSYLTKYLINLDFRTA